MPVPNFIPGVFKDPVDERDYLMSSVFRDIGAEIAYPKTLDLRKDMTPIRNQGSRGTCVAFTAAAIKEWQEKTDTGYTGNMSPEFIYFYRENKPAEGMHSRDVMSILAKHGCCTESKLPYVSDINKIPTEIPSAASKDALNYTIKDYARINTLEELKTALYQSGPCYISFPVYDTMPEFWRQKGEEPIRGGHAVCVVGYNDSGFILRNSWGKSFGDAGYVVYPYTDFGKHWDIWCCVDIRGSPKPPPEKQKCCEII